MSKRGLFLQVAGIATLLVIVFFLYSSWMSSTDYYVPSVAREKREVDETPAAELLDQMRQALQNVVHEVSEVIPTASTSSTSSTTANVVAANLPYSSNIGGCSVCKEERDGPQTQILFDLPISQKISECGASGLTRAGGFVCLDKETRHLLSTRGGNITF